jgi:hypothetical protein
MGVKKLLHHTPESHQSLASLPGFRQGFQCYSLTSGSSLKPLNSYFRRFPPKYVVFWLEILICMPINVVRKLANLLENLVNESRQDFGSCNLNVTIPKREGHMAPSSSVAEWPLSDTSTCKN